MIEEGYDTDDAFFKGMDELEPYLLGAGLDVSTAFRGWEAGIEILGDVSGEYNGQAVELSIESLFTVYGFGITPGPSLTWLSEKTVDGEQRPEPQNPRATED